MTNLPAKLSTLQQEISALTEQLAQASADEIGQCIEGLMSGGMRLSETITAKNPVDEYRRSLRHVPVYGLRRAYSKLKRGEYENINLAFIPLPSELAAMAMAESRLIREDRIRKQETLAALQEIDTAPRHYGFRDLRIVHRERAVELAAKGYVKVADGINQQMFGSLAKSRGLPAGSVLLWAIDEVWAPEAVARYVDLSRVESSKRMAAPEREMLSPERAAELEKMLALPDAKDIRAEQMAYRSLVENEVAAAKVDEEVSHAA